ncbi:MAG: DUF4157 domain-containing protein [Dehalococcoidia bacterium]|nr:DUF4157 domain-containing protein [Dehalococcoidia bacterium]
MGQQVAQHAAGRAAPRPATAGRRLAPAPRGAPALQGVLGNHGALRRPDAAEHEARHTARRVAAGLSAPASVRERGASSPLGAWTSPLGAGAPLPALILAAMEAALGADFGSVRIHAGARAAEHARASRARAVTTGEHIAFAHGMYRPETSDGRMLIAHELTHVMQQRARGVVRPQFDDDDDLVAPSTPDATTATGAHADPPIHLRVDMRGVTVSSPGRRYDRGKQKPPQLMALLLRRLVTDYEPGLEDELLARLPDDDRVRRFGDLASEREAGEDDRMPDVFVELGPLGIMLRTLEELGHPHFTLTDEQWRILGLGSTSAEWWNRNPWLHEDYPWYTGRLFMSHVAQHGQLVADMETAETPLAYLDAELVFTNHLMEAIGLMEEVRLDPALAEHPVAGGVWRAIWGEPGESPSAEVKRPDLAVQLMSYYWMQRALGRQATVNAERRAEFMQRFTRWLLRVAPSVTAGDVTRRLLEQPAQITDPPHPATLRAFPPPHGPARVVPAAKDRRFEFNVEFPDAQAAFAHYQYAWDVIRWESSPGQEQAAVEEVAARETDAATRTEGAERARISDVVGARLGRDLRDARTDIERIEGMFGPAGIVVATPLYLNALVLRPFGTLIGSIVDLVTLSTGPGRRERPIQFPEPGVFVVRVSAVPVVDDLTEVRRPPSVAYVAVFAQDEADFARAQLGEAIDTAEAQDEARAQYTQTLRELLVDESDPELQATLMRLLREAERDESYWPRLRAMKERLDTRITEIDAELTRLREERPSVGSARVEGDAAIAVLRAERERMNAQRDQLQQLLAMRAGRARDYPQLGSARPLYVGFVSDEGEARQLTIEWAALHPREASISTRLAAPSGSHFVVLSDHTTQNGGIVEGYGATEDAAIVHAVRSVLESRFGYGRGEASIRLPGGSTRDLRIERDLRALTSEAIENVSLVITVAAVAAAPFTTGASLLILVPVGIVGGGHAAYRMYTRYEASTLRWDLQTAMDIVDIVGAAVQAGAAIRSVRAGMQAARFGRVLAVTYEFAEDGAGYILLGLQLEKQLKDIADSQTMSEGEKRARRVMALGSAMLEAGLMVGQRVFKQGADDLRAAREELGALTVESTADASTDSATAPTDSATPAPVDTASPAPETTPPEARPSEARAVEAPAPETRPSEARPTEAPAPEVATPETATPAPATAEAARPEAAPSEAASVESPAPEVAVADATPTPDAAAPDTGAPDTAGQHAVDITPPAEASPTPEATPAPQAEASTAREGTPTPQAEVPAPVQVTADARSSPSRVTPAEGPRSRAQLEQAVAGLIADGRFTDPALEVAYGRYQGDATRAEWVWRTGGRPLARLRELLGPDFRPPRTAAPVVAEATPQARTPEAAAEVGTREAATPEPATPEPATPEPVAPEPATPEPTASEVTPEAEPRDSGGLDVPVSEVHPSEVRAPEVASPEAAPAEVGTPGVTTPAAVTPSPDVVTPRVEAEPANPLAEVSEATLRRRAGDPMAPRDREADAELERRYRDLPIVRLVEMAQRGSRWHGAYARQVLDTGGGRRGTLAEYLAEGGTLDQVRQAALYDPAAAEALVERYYRDFTPQQLENLASAGDQSARYVLENPRRWPQMETAAEARLVEAVWEQRRTASEAEEARALRSRDPAVRAQARARARTALEAGTVGAMETDIPGIDGQVVRGSPNAPTTIDADQPRHVRPSTDIALAQFHAEEQLLNRLISRIGEAGLGQEQLNGRRVRIVVDQRVCSYCLSGLASGEHGGTLRQFTERYPGLRVEITDLRTGDFLVLSGGRREVHHRRAGTVEDQ